MEFYTNYKRPPRMQEAFANKEQKIYKEDINTKTGERTLKVDKTINIYNKIQEYKDDVDISKILKNYNLDLHKQLKNEEEKLVDLTNLPTNLMEAMKVIDDAKYAWDRQSKDIKTKFENNFNKFIAASENGQLADLLSKEIKTNTARFTNEIQSQMTYQAPVASVEPTQPTQQTQGGINLNV